MDDQTILDRVDAAFEGVEIDQQVRLTLVRYVAGCRVVGADLDEAVSWLVRIWSGATKVPPNA